MSRLPEHGIILPAELTRRREAKTLGTFKAIEIGDEDLERSAVADMLVTDGYRPLFRNPVGTELLDITGFNEHVQQELLKRVVRDPYKLRGTTATVVAETLEQGEPQLIANMRCSFGKKDPSGRLYPIELMSLVEPKDGWDKVLKGLDIEQIGELGRVTVREDYRSEENTPRLIEVASDKAADIFIEGGVKKVFTVMQNRLRRHIKTPRLNFKRIPMRFRTEDEEAKETIYEFAKYWLDPVDPPQLLVATLDADPARRSRKAA